MIIVQDNQTGNKIGLKYGLLRAYGAHKKPYVYECFDNGI